MTSFDDDLDDDFDDESEDGFDDELDDESPDTYSVSELSDAVNDALSDSFGGGVWVWGEITGLNFKAPHTYFTLLEQLPKGKKAQLSVNLWAGEMARIRPILVKNGLELANGLRVRVYGDLDFYAPFGKLSLVMRGIDPKFTLGEIALEREALVRKLREMGLYDQNRELELSPVPLRVGVVTSESSAAWADFRNQLEASGLGFRVLLSDVRVQGDSAVADVSRAVRDLGRRDDLDVVCVIRGGGGKGELATFDAEEIAMAITHCPLPVFTGIGHEIDTSVADEVAFERHKTPTACAVALIERVRAFVDRTEQTWSSIAQVSSSVLDGEDVRIGNLMRNIASRTMVAVDRADERLLARVARLEHIGPRAVADRSREISVLADRLRRVVPRHIDDRTREVDRLHEKVRLLDPRNVLARGFSITRDLDGRVVRSVNDVEGGRVIITTFADGTIKSTVDGGEP